MGGLAPAKAGVRLFMVMQAFLDESFEQDGIFVLAGYISTAEKWSSFSGEWESLLRPFGTLREDGKYHFKMKEMARNEERRGRVQIFSDVIEKHVLGWVSARMDAQSLKRAIARISVPGLKIDWGEYANPYFVTFKCLIDNFHTNRSKMSEALGDEKIDFYFDDRSDKLAIIDTWERYLGGHPPEVRRYFGATPRFEDDTEFLPLQAADLLAWWIRKWAVDGEPEKIKDFDFGGFKMRSGKRFLNVRMLIDEDDIVTDLSERLRSEFRIKGVPYEVIVS